MDRTGCGIAFPGHQEPRGTGSREVQRARGRREGSGLRPGLGRTAGSRSSRGTTDEMGTNINDHMDRWDISRGLLYLEIMTIR